MIRSIPAALCALLLAAPALRAQGTPDTAKKVTFTGNLGFVNVSGNTSVTTLNAGEELGYAAPHGFGVKQTFAAVYGKTGGTESANLWQADVRADKALSSRWGVYGLVAFDRDRFAGIDRRFQEGVGALYRALASARDSLDVELGAGYVQLRTDSALSENHPEGRAATTYRHHFAPKTYAEEIVEVLPDLQHTDNYRLNSETSVVAPLSQSLSLKVDYIVRYMNLPAPGRKKADRFLTTGIQFSF